MSIYLCRRISSFPWVWMQLGRVGTSSWWPGRFHLKTSHLLKWRLHKWRKQTLNVLWFCTGVQPWPGSLAAPVCLSNILITLSVRCWTTTLGAPRAKRRTTQNNSMAHIFITLSWGQLGIFTVFVIYSAQIVLFGRKRQDNLMLARRKTAALFCRHI